MITDLDKEFLAQMRESVRVIRMRFGEVADTWESPRLLKIIETQARDLRRLRTQMNAQNTKEK